MICYIFNASTPAPLNNYTTEIAFFLGLRALRARRSPSKAGGACGRAEEQRAAAAGAAALR